MTLALNDALAVYLYLKDQSCKTQEDNRALHQAWLVICKHARETTPAVTSPNRQGEA